MFNLESNLIELGFGKSFEIQFQFIRLIKSKKKLQVKLMNFACL